MVTTPLKSDLATSRHRQRGSQAKRYCDLAWGGVCSCTAVHRGTCRALDSWPHRPMHCVGNREGGPGSRSRGSRNWNGVLSQGRFHSCPAVPHSLVYFLFVNTPTGFITIITTITIQCSSSIYNILQMSALSPGAERDLTHLKSLTLSSISLFSSVLPPVLFNYLPS